MPVANCPNCRMPLECSHCRNLVDAEQLEGVYGEPLHGTDTGEARGSSGREAWTPRARSRFIASLGQRARSQYAASLASAETDDGTPFIRRVADQAWREAGADAPEFVGERALSDERFASWQVAAEAQARAVAANAALEQARLRLSRELDAFNRIAEPMPAWAFEDGPGLTAIDRDRR